MPRILRSLSVFMVLIAADAAYGGGDLVHPPKWPCSGCGPRYWGAQHEQGWCPDPCDSCNRWVGCNGTREMPDRLAAWQLPPNRGFQPPEQFGWETLSSCEECNHCGPSVHRWWKWPHRLWTWW